jgi:hypothetical protein
MPMLHRNRRDEPPPPPGAIVTATGALSTIGGVYMRRGHFPSYCGTCLIMIQNGFGLIAYRELPAERDSFYQFSTRVLQSEDQLPRPKDIRAEEPRWGKPFTKIFTVLIAFSSIGCVLVIMKYEINIS